MTFIVFWCGLGLCATVWYRAVYSLHSGHPGRGSITGLPQRTLSKPNISPLPWHSDSKSGSTPGGEWGFMEGHKSKSTATVMEHRDFFIVCPELWACLPTAEAD